MTPPAAPYWHGYYDADEIADIDRAIRETTARVRGADLCVRVYEQTGQAPTVLIAHGLLGYGRSFARFHLPFWRHGWRVVQFDLPGMGESPGKRGAVTIREMIDCWREMACWTAQHYSGPLFTIGNAEDSVVSYYALANNPVIAAMSVHTFFEYGEPHGVGWIRPSAARHILRPLFGGLERINPNLSLPGTWTIPWRHVFGGPGDATYRDHLARDPLALQRGRVTLGRSLMAPFKPPVPFEDCTTPIQVIISRRSRIWPAGPVRRSAERLGGPREIIELDAPHWEANRRFHDAYCALAITWFERWCAPNKAGGFAPS